jgi:putative ABC transport system permease protein
MAPRALLRLGLHGLLQHKLRSTLSILGVVFGVAAVVAMSSVGEGARREAVSQIGALGIDSITLRAQPGGEGAAEGLRLRDADAVRQVIPAVLAVAPLREAALTAQAGGRLAPAVVVGTTPSYREAARLRLARGRFLSDIDVSEGKRVAVLGAFVAAALFPLGDARGQQVEIGGDWFHVVGVLEGRAPPKGKASPIRTRDVNRAIFVPLPALDRGATDPRPDGVDEIVIRVRDDRDVAASAETAKTVVRRTSGGAAFEVVVPREILRQKERTQRIFNVVTGATAAISLLVGGIGIMNIMLASVAERTREVGIRRALGASREDIAAQFLAESSLLTAAGGVAGAILGMAGSSLIQRLAEWPTALSPLMLLLALLTAVAVGVGFGFYPAWRAAHLEPMEALRQE